MCSTITDDGTRGTESGKERFKKFANYSGVVGGERLCIQPIGRQESTATSKVFCFLLYDGNGPLKSMPQTSKNSQTLDGILSYILDEGFSSLKDSRFARFSAPFLSRMITSHSWSKRSTASVIGLASFLE
ncbi:hypothetical protein Tco_1020455 [Tanacetum coccineum]